jgi:four helix bundle protein
VLSLSSGDRHHRLHRLKIFTVKPEGQSMSGTYRDLKAWQIAMDMVRDVYRLTREFPREETYGLTIQLRRAAVSIASNIAEGKGRSSDKELLHFLSNAKGSLFEVETQVMIAASLGYLTDSQSEELLSRTAEVGRLLNGLMKVFRNVPRPEA